MTKKVTLGRKYSSTFGRMRIYLMIDSKHIESFENTPAGFSEAKQEFQSLIVKVQSGEFKEGVIMEETVTIPEAFDSTNVEVK